MFIDSVALLLSHGVALLLVLRLVDRGALLAVLGGADRLVDSLTDVLIDGVALLSRARTGQKRNIKQYGGQPWLSLAI